MRAIFQFLMVLGILAQAQTRVSIAVSDLDARGMSKDDAGIISDRLRDELLNTGTFRVMERTVMDQILREQSFQASGVCSGSDCQVQMGRLLGVDRLVIGSVGKLGALYTLNVRMLNVETGEIEQSFSQDHQGAIEDLVRGPIRNVATKLAWAVANKHTPKPAPVTSMNTTPPPVAAPPQAPVVATPTPAPASVTPSSSFSDRPPVELGVRLNLGAVALKGDTVMEYLFKDNEAFWQLGGEIRINMSTVSLAPELLYTRRIVVTEKKLLGSDFYFELQTDYLSVPILLDVHFTRNLYIFAGPALDINLSHEVTVEVDDEEVDEDGLREGGMNYLADFEMKKVYASLVFGGGFRLGSGFIMDFRYQHPLSDAYSDSGTNETAGISYDLSFRYSNWALSFGYLF